MSISEDLMNSRKNEVNKLLSLMEKEYPVVKDIREIMRTVNSLHNVFLTKNEQITTMKELNFKLSQLQKKVNQSGRQ